jgi:hypothetical protein
LTLHYWTVRKSANGGASWSTVDASILSSSGFSIANAFAADANGNLFVGGAAYSSSGSQWLVRENPGGTGAWQTVDTFQYGKGAQPYAVIGAGVNVFTAGYAIDAAGARHWIVRKR